MDTNTRPKHQVSRSLRTRQIIFMLIAVVLVGSTAYDVIIGDIAWWLALGGLAIGAIVGFVVGRFRSVRWHETRQEVVSQLDVVGVAAILVYVAFDVSKDWLFGHWFSGVALTTFTLAVVAGLLIGRFIAVQQSIKKVLREQSY